MTPPVRQRTRGRWVILGVIGWLILASSIALEEGQATVATWGSTVTLVFIGLLSLLAAGRAAFIPVRGVCRRVSRWAVGRCR